MSSENAHTDAAGTGDVEAVLEHAAGSGMSATAIHSELRRATSRSPVVATAVVCVAAMVALLVHDLVAYWGQVVGLPPFATRVVGVCVPLAAAVIVANVLLRRLSAPIRGSQAQVELAGRLIASAGASCGPALAYTLLRGVTSGRIALPQTDRDWQGRTYLDVFALTGSAELVEALVSSGQPHVWAEELRHRLEQLAAVGYTPAQLAALGHGALAKKFSLVQLAAMTDLLPRAAGPETS